jgi:erythromycin esterase-like protein
VTRTSEVWRARPLDRFFAYAGGDRGGAVARGRSASTNRAGTRARDGVVYSPHGEPRSHYRTSRPIDRYDALYHFDVTRALDSI